MPIRINLLAEQQAAEEMRRRDPVKRALYAGSFLVALMVLWIGLTQVKVSAARKDLAEHAARLAQIEAGSKEVKEKQAEIMIATSTIEALDRYAETRFFWGTFLDELQQIAVEKLRLVETRGDHKYLTNDTARLFGTNLTVTFVPPPPAWKFWASGKDNESVEELVANALGTITNRGPFLTNKLAYSLKTTLVSTNGPKIGTKLEFNTKPWGSERITVTIRGRDYGTPPGAAIDEFARRIGRSEFFQEWLQESEGFRFTERPPQPRPDPADPINPGAMFVPFTIECRLKERVFTNE